LKSYQFFLLALILLSACAPVTVSQPSVSPTAVIEPTRTATQMPSQTPIIEPTSSPPEPTLTAVPPTITVTPSVTPLPPMAVLENGFNVWCAPLEYSGTRPASQEVPEYARIMTYSDEQPVVPIPAVYCVVSFQFNQVVDIELELRVSDKSSVFMRKPLDVADGQKDVAWTVLNHPYIVNPPLWQVNYTLAIFDQNETKLWTEPVKFARPLPETCLFGGLPDPVTLYCAISDPWEIEPHPDAVYPYDRSRLTPDP